MNRHLAPRVVIIAVAVAIAASLLAFSNRNAGAQEAVKTVIVQLASEPVVVAKFRAESAGQPFDVQAYRQQVIAEQETFLSRAAAAGVPYVVSGVNAPNGEVTAPIQFRFNYVYNGVTLDVPESALPALKQVEGAPPSTRRRPSTRRSTAPSTTCARPGSTATRRA